MTITALETSYAGCRFRSRLEARWAVFFDTVGIKWEYEPQGYDVPTATGSRPYLPDFRLPALSMFVEVKGESDRLDPQLLADFTREHKESFTAVLGAIPIVEAGKMPLHSLFVKSFDFEAGNEPSPVPRLNRALTAMENLGDDDLHAVRELLGYESRQRVACYRSFFLHGHGMWGLMPFGLPNVAMTPENILNPGTAWPIIPHPKLVTGYHAARSARFEHGEQG